MDAWSQTFACQTWEFETRRSSKMLRQTYFTLTIKCGVSCSLELTRGWCCRSGYHRALILINCCILFCNGYKNSRCELSYNKLIRDDKWLKWVRSRYIRTYSACVASLMHKWGNSQYLSSIVFFYTLLKLIITYIYFYCLIFLAAMPLYTRPRIVVGGGVGVDHFIFTRKRLGGISSNFAYAFIVLLISYCQSVN